MMAIVYERYGSAGVLHPARIEPPVLSDDRVLVRVRAVSLNAADWRMMRARPRVFRLYTGLLRPRIRVLGADIAGVVEAVGRNVTRVAPGDEVYGDIALCGMGGLAEYALADENVLAPKPAGLSFEEAAAVPMAGVTALQAVRDAAALRPGQEVLVHGASGGVGTMVLQLAKHAGAAVTAVCSGRHADLARSLGARRVIDYTVEDFAADATRYDAVLAVNGNRPIGDYRRVLRPGGVYVMVGGGTRQLFQALLLGPLLSLGGKRMRVHAAAANRDDLVLLAALLEAGTIRPVIDRRYTLAETAEAMRYFEEGHPKGKVVITVP